MNARTIKATLEAWDATGHLPACTREATAAEALLCETVKSALLAIDGIDGVTFECGSAGSIYFECYSDASDDQNISIKVRVSNHKAGRRANELAADFVVGDSVEEIERQLAKVAEAIAAEINFVLN